MSISKLSIIIPCYNERFTIEFILLKVLCAPYMLEQKEIIIIDDYSTDGSREILRKLEKDWNGGLYNILKKWINKHPSNILYKDLFERNVASTSFKLLFHEKNKGKGAALRTGIKETSGDLILIQDADLEYDPFEYPKLLAPLLNGEAEVVFGSRYLGETRRVLNFRHTHINKLLTLMSNFLSDLNLTDMETCYKVFKSSILKTICLKSDRFGFEPEVTAKLAHLGCLIYEVPISYSGRTYEEGKKIGLKDAFQAFWCIFKYNLFPGQIVKDLNTQDTYRMSEAINYNKEIFNNIKIYCGNKILEAGAAIGSFTSFFKNKHEVTATDIDKESLNILTNRFQNSLNVEIIKWDLNTTAPEEIKKSSFDTITAINVLEHIEDDIAVMRKFNSILPEQGNVIIMSPASKFLFSRLDKKLGHKRRYTKKELKEKLELAGFKIEKLYYYNFPGFLGWLFFIKIFNKNLIPKSEIRFFDLFAKYYLPMERKFLKIPFGLSIIAIARKE